MGRGFLALGTPPRPRGGSIAAPHWWPALRRSVLHSAPTKGRLHCGVSVSLTEALMADGTPPRPRGGSIAAFTAHRRQPHSELHSAPTKGRLHCGGFRRRYRRVLVRRHSAPTKGRLHCGAVLHREKWEELPALRPDQGAAPLRLDAGVKGRPLIAPLRPDQGAAPLRPPGAVGALYPRGDTPPRPRGGSIAAQPCRASLRLERQHSAPTKGRLHCGASMLYVDPDTFPHSAPTKGRLHCGRDFLLGARELKGTTPPRPRGGSIAADR